MLVNTLYKAWVVELESYEVQGFFRHSTTRNFAHPQAASPRTWTVVWWSTKQGPMRSKWPISGTTLIITTQCPVNPVCSIHFSPTFREDCVRGRLWSRGGALQFPIISRTMAVGLPIGTIIPPGLWKQFHGFHTRRFYPPIAACKVI
jgi:hypothetical protein